VQGQEKKGYLILASEDLPFSSKEFNNFVNHKRNQNYEVYVVYLRQILPETITAQKAADTIRSWLKSFCESTPVSYLLITGLPDPEISAIPMKMISLYGSPPVYTDYYYAELSSSWDNNGNGILGEEEDIKSPLFDNLPELSVGRIPVTYNTITQFDKILLKIMSYENQTSIDWRKHVLLPMNPLDVYTPSYQHGEAIINNIIIPKQWYSHRLYDDVNGGAPIPDVVNLKKTLQEPQLFVPCNYANVKKAWQEQLPGLVIWIAHGNDLGTTAIDVMTIPITTTLNDAFPSITFQTSCYNSNPYNFNNLSYSLFYNGAVAAVGATKLVSSSGSFVDINPDGDNYAQTMAYKFAKHLVTDGMEAGEALNCIRSLKPSNKLTGEWWSLYWSNNLAFNLYGCPDATLGFPRATNAPTYLKARGISNNAVKVWWIDNSKDDIAFCIEKRREGQTSWDFEH